MKVLSLSYSNLKNIVGGLIFLELFLMGSGQLIPIYGGITLRMLNFFIMFLLGGITILQGRKIATLLGQLLIYYSIICFLSIIIGLMNGGGSNIILDIKPLSYFLTIPFMYFFLDDVSTIKVVINILKKSVLILSIIYIIYVGLFYLNYYDFWDVYAILKDYPDFMFRGWSGFIFYKGFIFLPIGLAFYNINKGLLSWQSIVLLVAIYLTQTRGFWLLGILSYIFSILYKLRKNELRIPFFKVVFFSIIVISVLAYLIMTFKGFDGDRASGDSIRLETIKQVMERVTILSFFIGHGFGIGVPIREIHMEMSYLEIFHKQGILGLVFFIVLWFDTLNLLFKIKNNRDLVAFMVIGINLVYIQSFFNPYITNSIGMGFVLFAYASLKRMEYLQE